MSGPAVRVEGLKELRKAFRDVDKDLPKTIRAATKEIAEFLVAPAKARATAVGGATSKMSPSIRAGGDQRSAFIRFGGRGYEMAGGGEFGSYRTHGKDNPTARGGYTTQFKYFNREGYAVYPTIRERSEEIRRRAERSLQALIDRNI